MREIGVTLAPNHAEGVYEIRNLLRYGIATKERMESSRSDVWNQSEGKCTLVRDLTLLAVRQIGIYQITFRFLRTYNTAH